MNDHHVSEGRQKAEGQETTANVRDTAYTFMFDALPLAARAKFCPNDPWLTQKGQKYCFNNKTLGVPQIENNVKDFSKTLR